MNARQSVISMESTSLALGLDGCRAGWVVVAARWRVGRPEAIDWQGRIVSSLADALAIWPEAATVAIDIPMGLTESGPRQCDRLGRALLPRARRSSIFPAPVRSALAGRTRAEADALHRQADGRGVAAQTFNLFPKIREVDNWLRTQPKWRGRIIEVHPEVVYTLWNEQGPLLGSKKTAEGQRQRAELIRARWGLAPLSQVRASLHDAGHRRADFAEDDLLDAFAVTGAAIRRTQGYALCWPDPPETDRFGLTMALFA